MHLSFAYVHHGSSDINQRMHKYIILEDDLDFPLHPSFLKDLLLQTRFTDAFYIEELCHVCDYENLCHVDDNMNTPLGARYSISFIDTLLLSLLEKYSDFEHLHALKRFYYKRVMKLLKDSTKDNKYDFYYITVDTEATAKLSGERYEQYRVKEKQLLYDPSEPPVCFFDQSYLYDLHIYFDHGYKTDESHRRYIKQSIEIFKGGEAKFTNNYHSHIFKKDKNYALDLFIDINTIQFYKEKGGNA